MLLRSEIPKIQYHTGILGASAMQVLSHTTYASRPTASKAPRYQFGSKDDSAKRFSMGPPTDPPRTLKRKLVPQL